MKNCRQHIMNYAHSQPYFGLRDLYDYLEKDCNSTITRKTISWYLTQLVELGELQRLSRGKYAVAFRQQFQIIPTEEQHKLIKDLNQKWPYAHFCIYNGSIISPLQHHISANNITYIETERETIVAVFNYLRDNGKVAYLQPTRQLISNYIDLSQPAIFVKPLITESPIQECGGIFVPTLEKLLVDLQKDKDFFYLQELEGFHIFQNALSLYAVNISRLFRYADRRGIKDEVKAIIETINSYD